MQIARRFSSSTIFKRVFDVTKRSYTAASDVASSDAPTTKRKEKVSLVKRKAMVESYVNKYRDMNSGKFPTCTGVQKEVGGKYYTIKRFVQELEYNSRNSPPSIKDENTPIQVSKSSENSTPKMTIRRKVETKGEKLLVKEVVNDCKTLPDLEQVKETLSSQGVDKSIEVEKVLSRDAVKTESDNKNKPFGEGEEGLVSQIEIDLGPKNDQILDEDSDFSELDDGLSTDLGDKASIDEIKGPSATEGNTITDTAEEIKVKSHQLKEEAFVSDLLCDKTRSKLEQEGVSKDLPKVEGLEPAKEQLHEAEKPETITRDLYKEHVDEKQTQVKSFTWENLKSFANGIVDYWKKL